MTVDAMSSESPCIMPDSAMLTIGSPALHPRIAHALQVLASCDVPHSRADRQSTLPVTLSDLCTRLVAMSPLQNLLLPTDDGAAGCVSLSAALSAPCVCAPGLSAPSPKSPLRVWMLAVAGLFLLVFVLLTLHSLSGHNSVSDVSMTPSVGRHTFHTNALPDAAIHIPDSVVDEEDEVTTEAERLLHLLRREQLEGSAVQAGVADELSTAQSTSTDKGGVRAVTDAEFVVQQRPAGGEVRSLDDAAVQSLRWTTEVVAPRSQPSNPIPNKRGGGPKRHLKASGG